MMNSSEARETIWERRITVLFVGLLIMIGGWTAIGVHNQSSLVGRIEERLDGLGKQFGRMEQLIQNQYTKEDAARDFTVRDRQIEDLRERVRKLEQGP